MQFKIPEGTYLIENRLFRGLYLSYFGSKLSFLEKREDLSQYWHFVNGTFTNLDYKWKLELSNYDEYYYDGTSIISKDGKMALTVHGEENVTLEKASSLGIPIPSQTMNLISANYLFSSTKKCDGDENREEFENLVYVHDVFNPLKGFGFYFQFPFYGAKGFFGHDPSFGVSLSNLSSSNQLWYFNDGVIMNASTFRYLKYSPCSDSLTFVSKPPKTNKWIFDGQHLIVLELSHILQLDPRESSSKFVRIIPRPSSHEKIDLLNFTKELNEKSLQWSIFLDRIERNVQSKNKEMKRLFVSCEDDFHEFLRSHPSFVQSLRFDPRDHLKHLIQVQECLWKDEEYLTEKQRLKIENFKSKNENNKRKKETKAMEKNVKHSEKMESKKFKTERKKKKKEEKRERKMVKKKEKSKKSIRNNELRKWLVQNGIEKKKVFKRFRKKSLSVRDIFQMNKEELGEIVVDPIDLSKIKEIVFTSNYEERNDMESDDDDDEDDDESSEEEEEDGEDD